MFHRKPACGRFEAVTGSLTLAYTRGLGTDNLVALHRYSDNTDYYVVQDALGSVRGLARRDGTWLASWRYGIYGAVLDSAGSAPLSARYRWTGRELDEETGFYFFRARYYDPGVQRFVQEDPIGYAGGRNLYAYGDGNPTNGRDPDGLKMDYEQPMSDPFSPCLSSLCRGPAIYIDGAPVGGGSGSLPGLWGDALSSLFGTAVRLDQWSPPTTVERRAALTAYYNAVGALEAQLDLISHAAIVYNETAGLRGELEEARAAIAEVILNRLAKGPGYAVGNGVGTAVDFLSSAALRAINAGNPNAVAAWHSSLLAAGEARMPGDFTGGALYFYISTSLPRLRWLAGQPTLIYGPFTNVQGAGQWYVWVW